MDESGTPASGLSPVVSIPVMNKERFAELTGLEIGVVRGMVDRGYLPTVKIGRHRMINVAALQAKCLADMEAVEEEPAGYGRC